MNVLLSLFLVLSVLGDEALRYASLLSSSIGPRPAGSAAGGRAADEIFSALQSCGYEPKRHTFSVIDRPGVEALGQHYLPPTEAHLSGQNIWARLGPEGAPAILVGAHYDSVSVRGPGAKDNAAGVGVMLSAACAMKKSSWRGSHSIIFVAFDAEEINLLGSAAFVRDKPAGPIELALALDVLGDDHLSLNGLSPLVGGALLSAALSASSKSNVSVETPFAQMIISRLLPQGERSDHGPFTAAGIPAFQLYSRGEYGFDPYYHAPEDAADRLSSAHLDEAVRWIIAFLPEADRALPQNAAGEALPVSLFVLPGWLLRLLCVASLALSVAAFISAYRRTKPSAVKIIRSLFSWGLLSVVLALSFFVPFLLGCFMTGFNTPWLPGMFWYTVAGGSCMLLVACLVASTRLRDYLSGERRFAVFSLVLLSLVLLLVQLFSLTAAAPFSLAVFFVALSCLSPKLRWLSLIGPLVGAWLLSPDRYVEGVLTGTLAAGGWLYSAALWLVLLVFGSPLVGLVSSLRRTLPRLLLLPVAALAVGLALFAATQAPYTRELPRRVLAHIVYQESGAFGDIFSLRGESLSGLSLKAPGGVISLDDTNRISLPTKRLADLRTSPVSLAEGTGLEVSLTPVDAVFVQALLEYHVVLRDGTPVAFQYLSKDGTWREVSSPLGLRVGFYGDVESIFERRAFRLPEGGSLYVNVSADLQSVPAEVSFVPSDATLFEVSASFSGVGFLSQLE